MTCPSKTGPDTRLTGEKSAVPFENELGTVVKAVQPIQNAAPEMANLTPSPEAALSLLSPTSIMTQGTATPTISVPCASDAISPMTPNTTPEPDNAPKTSLVTTGNPLSLSGKNKKPSRQELLRAIQGDELALRQHAILLEAYKPTMDAIKLYLEIHGSQSPNFYMTKNKQVAAACQMNGLNDPSATRKQRIAAMTCYEMLMEAIMTGIESGLDKERVKQMMNNAINRAAEFFNLGNKKAIAQREKAAKKAQRKAA